MMKGKIIKGIAGLYYVLVPKKGLYECKARGIFRKEHLKPMVGDNVSIDIIDEDTQTGIISDIQDRTNALIRPSVANIDQALIVFATAQPNPSANLLDRFLIMMERQNVPVIICLNKVDLSDEEDEKLFTSVYEKAGYETITVSAARHENIDGLMNALKGKCTALAGPSGVGKSSLINIIQSGVHMDTGAISAKLKRGKHTTRHVQLINISDNTWIMDTPGFTSLSLPEDIKVEELKEYYPEFARQGNCKYLSCMHLKEPGCLIKEAVENEKISRIRYNNYCLLAEELKKNAANKFC